MAVLLPSLAHPFWYATDANAWATELWPHLPMHAMMGDPAALRGFYLGDETIYDPRNWRPWLGPGLLWASFICTTQLMCLAVNVLMRRQWTRNERLSFPLVVLPIEMTDTGRHVIWRNRLLWVGFGVAALVNIVNGLHVYFPAIPAIPVGYKWMSVSPRWRAEFMPLARAFYPFVIGTAYLLPGDLTFSIWFFFWFTKLQRVTFSALGYPIGGIYQTGTRIATAPAVLEQSIGAYMAVVFFALRAGRRHIADIWRTVCGMEPLYARQGFSPAEAAEYRTALITLGAGLVLTTWFAHTLGMPALTGLAYILLYLIINTAITRIRAEAGAPTHGYHFAGPDHVLLTMLAPAKMQVREMSAWALMFGFNRGYTGVPMPHQLEGMKMGEMVGAERQRMTVAQALAIVIGSYAAVWALLHLCYAEGVEQMRQPVKYLSRQGWRIVDVWLRRPIDANWPGLVAIGVGFAFSSLLMILRFRFVWWPFHPIGYAIAPDWTTGVIWMPLFLGWLAKAVTMRYFGPKIYRAGLPLALGLMLGDFTLGGFWSLLAMFTRRPQYHFWP